MKKNLLTLLAAGLMLASCSKSDPTASSENGTGEKLTITAGTVNVSKDVTNVDIPVDATGYNTKFPDEAEPWDLAKRYTPGFVLSKASIMRYPGGTVTNYWDFDNDKLFKKKGNAPYPAGGWVTATAANIPESIAYDVIDSGTQQVNTVPDLKNVVNQSGCSVMFVMNMTTPGWDYYQIENPSWSAPVAGDLSTGSTWKKMLDNRYLRFKNMLNRAIANGIPVKYIELGNELYFFSNYYKQAFPSGTEYAVAANYIAGKIQADFPISNLKISGVASAESTTSTNARVTGWNGQAVPNFDKQKIHSVSMHSYYDTPQPASFTESTFHSTILDWVSLAQSYFGMNNTQTKVFDQNWRAWYTEVFANDKQDHNWGNVLLNLYSPLYFYQYANNYIYLQSRFDAQVTSSITLKQRAAGFVPFMQAASGGTKTNRLIFDGGGTIGSSVRKVLQGYVFETVNSTRKAVVINLSGTAKTINMQGSTLFPAGNVTLSGKVSTLNSVDVPDDIVNTTYSSDNITIAPYSINYIRL